MSVEWLWEPGGVRDGFCKVLRPVSVRIHRAAGASQVCGLAIGASR